MDGYEPSIADPADYAVPKAFRMVDAYVHWWDHADKTVTWGVASRNWQHPRSCGRGDWARMRRWIRECVETFTPDRCMFGSNFHVERLFVTLPKLFRTYRRAVEDYTPAEEDQMFAGTAERVYRI